MLLSWFHSGIIYHTSKSLKRYRIQNQTLGSKSYFDIKFLWVPGCLVLISHKYVFLLRPLQEPLITGFKIS